MKITKQQLQRIVETVIRENNELNIGGYTYTLTPTSPSDTTVSYNGKELFTVSWVGHEQRYQTKRGRSWRDPTGQWGDSVEDVIQQWHDIKIQNDGGFER